ncbi:MAG: hypothetical protein COX65_09370 [Elusimicrobia bacterium CG_4_10_14_0_2_um_filter_56_8]|nr:MAG: hypothetical protein AUJ51_01295 [Elusimicrobia bacterium CG1_02_56_21]PJA11934.1 MAG: hypothetical protein COX65_09370 [Elusimicrobia bacterium CG_4_10_14_0_2_um_filter_56_8]
MKTNKLLLILAALPCFWGCASFNSGDILVERGTARAMLEDKTVIPFSEIEIYWQNFPYRSATDSIGEGSISRPKKIKPVAVDPEDAAALGRRAREIFAEAGLYNKQRGRGTLRLELTSFGRWTYGELFRSYLVDTSFIFIIPSSLRVNYYLTADFALSTGTVRVETEARHKTTFHLLLAPLYPFFSPGARESGLLKQMLWRSATDVYSRLKAAGVAPRGLPPKETPVAEKHSLSGPPMQPDRTWLPSQSIEGNPAQSDPAIIPEKPDQTWAVPSALPQQAPAEPIDRKEPAKDPPGQQEPIDD